MKLIKRKPELLLLLMAAAIPISFATWQNLLNNFAIEQASFSGADMGILQSLREVPGFLAFTVVFVLFLMKEQTLAYVSLILLGLGTLLTGFFPSLQGLIITTFIMSVGFHYMETVHSSLTLQWVDKKDTPEFMGKLIAIRSAASILVFATIWLLFEKLGLNYQWIYLLGGGITVSIALWCWSSFSYFPEKVQQHKTLILRKRYWLFYALQFMTGARRQIFVVFAGFLMVEKFGFSVGEISLLFLINATLNTFLARRIGRLVGMIGERNALIIEYIGLIAVFVGYALVEVAAVAAALYVIDHLFFALAIAQKTYFQKIADHADIASTAGVSFTINHIAAVVIPVIFGVIWLSDPSLVFYAGAGMALVSLLLSLIVPKTPEPGNETTIPWLSWEKIPEKN